MSITRNPIAGIFAGVALTAASLCVNVALAQDAPAGSTNKLTAAEQKFMTKAAESNLAEVQMGHLAQQKGTTQAIKNYGQELVTDHTNADNELHKIATPAGMALPTEPNAHQKSMVEKLSKMSGTAFDHAFLNASIKDHRKDIAEYKKESKSASNAEMKNYITETMPVLEKHLQTAERISTGGKTTTPSE